MRSTFLLLAAALTACAPVIAEVGDSGDPVDTGDTGDSGDTGDTGDPDVRTCDTVVAELAKETERIRACESPDECGQVLVGTSCGCTREWVARLDADTSTFWELADEGQDKGCELPFGSPCDCPPADGFDCIEGQCAWKTPEPPPPAHFSDCRGADGAPVEITGMQTTRTGELAVGVAYSGGCAEHDFVVCWHDQRFEGGAWPGQATLEILHLTPGDPCDAYPHEEVRVNLAPMVEAYQDQYDSRSGWMRLYLDRYTSEYRFR